MCSSLSTFLVFVFYPVCFCLIVIQFYLDLGTQFLIRDFSSFFPLYIFFFLALTHFIFLIFIQFFQFSTSYLLSALILVHPCQKILQNSAEITKPYVFNPYFLVRSFKLLQFYIIHRLKYQRSSTLGCKDISWEYSCY